MLKYIRLYFKEYNCFYNSYFIINNYLIKFKIITEL
jgi:hypothetical protein